MRGLRWMVGCLLSLLVAACATDPHAPGTPAPLPRVVVGSGSTTVDDLMARIYAGALSRLGTTVVTRLDLGDRHAYLSALGRGIVSLVPDFTDDVLRYYDPEAASTEPVPAGGVSSSGRPRKGEGGHEIPTDPDGVRHELSRSLPEGISISDPSATTDWRAGMVMNEATADRIGAHSIADLAPHCAGLTLGIASGTTLPEALATDYHCRFAAVRSYPARLPADAVRTGQVGVAVVSPLFGTGPGVVALADDDYVFAARNPVPVYRSGTLSQLQLKTLNRVAGELKTEDLAVMVRRIVVHTDSAAGETRSWLDLHGF